MDLDDIVKLGLFAAWLVTGGTLLQARRARRGEAVRLASRAGYAGIALQVTGMAMAWGVGRENDARFAAGSSGELLLAAAVLALAGAAAAFAVSAVRVLGRQWSLAPSVVERHDLVDRGPYRVVRHPIYTAFFALLLATGAAFSTPLGMLAGSALYFLGTAVRVRFEERLLEKAFGARFEEYARRVPAFLPLPRIRRRQAA